MRTDLAKPEHIAAAVSRAKEMLIRGRAANAAQYAHGINSTISSIEFCLRKIEEGKFGDYGGLQILHDLVMKLGGYLYSLKEGL